MRFISTRAAWGRYPTILLLAAAYILFGRIALLLAIPPGYAMAVYPAAGIALGVVLVGGYALAPGVTLGSFLLNLWIGYETQGVITAASLVLPAIVAVGATLQALAGAWLIRRFVGYPTALDNETHILLFLLLGGPVASLVNACIGVGALFAVGIVRATNVLGNWATWWIGDTLGVLILTPLILIWLGEPRKIWRSRRWNVGTPLLVSLAIVVIAFLFVRESEQSQASWWVLVGGLFYTNLLGMYLLIVSAQAYKVDVLVTQRTRDLHVSERKLNENISLLAATTSLQRAILNSANFSIISTDTDGLIKVFNVGAQRMLGYSSDEMVDRCSPAILHDEGEIAARAVTLSQELARPIKPGFEVFIARARGGVADEHEWTYIRKDGGRLQVMLSVTGLWNEQHELTGFLGVAYDLTERKKIESIKNEFISTVSHELRTPLTSIRGALGLLIGGAAGELQHSARNLIAIANEDCDRLVRMVNDMLDIEKIDSGNMRFQMLPRHLQPLVLQAMTITQPYAAQFKVQFALQSDTVDDLVAVDADRITQVLVNFLSNAAKHSPPNDTVQVRLTGLPGWVRLSVIDHGEGIADEFRARIFQKFAQADGSDARQKGGTGLGLNISKAIVEKHHGHIDFHSTPGVDTEFYFELPIEPA